MVLDLKIKNKPKKITLKKDDWLGEINGEIKSVWSSKWNFAPKKIMVHDNKKIVVLGLKIDEKIWPTQKCSEAEKLTSKKKTSREEAETD